MGNVDVGYGAHIDEDDWKLLSFGRKWLLNRLTYGLMLESMVCRVSYRNAGTKLLK